MLNLITDRTQFDVDGARTLIESVKSGATPSAEYTNGLKGCYNHKDLNRVESAVRTLADSLNAQYGFDIIVTTKTNWTYTDIFKASDADRYIANLYALKSALNTINTLPPKTIIATNLVSNGSFENGLTGWTFEYLDSYSASNAKSKFGAYALQTQGSTSFSEGFAYSNVNYTKGHKYYVSCWALSEININKVEIVFPLQPPYPNVNYTLSQQNTWELVSFISSNPDINSGSLNLRLDNNNENNSNSIWFDGVSIIDLTQDFCNGVINTGNEPTKEWCDANISYFDGTQTIIQALKTINYTDANNIEKLLLDIEFIIEQITKSWYYSGEIVANEL